MRLKLLCLAILGVLMCMEGKAQISLKTEYIGSSAYMYLPKDADSAVKVGNNRGSSIVHSGFANIPVYMKMNANNRPTAWGVGLGGAYVSLMNKNFTDDMVSEIMNLNLGIFHLRPLNDKWSMMASIGAGVFSPTAEISRVRAKHVLGSAGVIFIRHFSYNLDLGVGVTLNNSFGYPMLFPALYLNWDYHKKFTANASLAEGVEVSVGYNFSDCFSLSATWDVTGQMALVEQDGKDKIFTHQYMITGLRPEFKLGKTGLSVPLTMGINIMRQAYFSDKGWKGMFDMDNDYYFSVSPYVSVGIKFGFGY